jgi:hypothetical protein
MFAHIRCLFGWIPSVFRLREDLVLENLAQRQQLMALQVKQPSPGSASLTNCFGSLFGQRGLDGNDL